MRKHVEVSSSDPNQLVTTYEGMHNHPLPPASSGASKGGMGRRSSLSGADGQTRGTRPPLRLHVVLALHKLLTLVSC